LIQCKGSVDKDELGWAAVRDVVAGTAAYQTQFPETTFSKVAITNQTFNDTAKNQARVNQVTLYDRTDLVKWLAQYPQRLSVISTM
jgi:HJR/Mrr/RecB family endonuclease